ncbi:TonB-dependent receptor [Sphingorhabdus sp.]|jgi:iron complex outermembrane receptor protein|uniref:TonB-dependent receptor n=1 Tax=Sphingorhabdus sp. TaxID=1902408 RepID=UPI003BB02D08|nr:TonB-dependent receptor [Sphingomonadales bacterium]MBK9432229.1 TonB-dependent receptor [Sphingomonadales bacterium]
MKQGTTANRARRIAASASALALAVSLSSAAMAQDAEAPAEEDAAAIEEDGAIVVTGLRYGLATSLNTKREELSIVEAVSAEDIGKLPDVSIAESISRLPGLTTQRVNGRAQVISIRGMAPDFSTTLLNGRQQASSGDNRGVEFDQYPSELLSSVVVYKTPDASISGMGLSGTADMRTVRPLAYGKQAIAVNVRGELNSGGKLNADMRHYGGRLSASYIDQNEAGTLGWAVGVAYLDAPSQTRHYKAYAYEVFGGDASRAALISPDSADRAVFLNGQEVFATSRQNKRAAAIGVLEWQPSDVTHLTADLYYSKFKQREVMRGAQWYSNVWADSQQFTNVQASDVGGSLVALAGTTTGVAPQLRNDYNTRDDELFSAGLNGEFDITDRLSFIADLSYSSNKRDESITETYAGFGCCATNLTQNANRVFDNISWDITDMLTGGFPTYGNGLNYADASRVSLGDRAPWGGWGHDGQTKEPHVKENVYALDLGFEYEMDGFFEKFDVGMNFTKREKTKRVDEFDLMLKNGRLQTLVGSDHLVDATSLGFAGFGNVLAVDLRTAIPAYYDKIVFINNDTFNKAWGIDEEVLTLRAKATINSGNLRGNIGVQVVNQRQQSTGSAINATLTPRVVTPVNVTAKYTDALPSLNLIYDLGGGHRLRLAAAKVMARPRMDEMRASFIPSFPRTPCTPTAQVPTPCVVGVERTGLWSATGGNALLEPWRAKALDLAYEWYIDKTSYISIAGFYKKLDSYIYTQRQIFDFTGLPIPPSSIQTPTNPNGLPAGVPVSPLGQIDQPANGKGGSIKGIEVSGALGFGKLASFLDGFGVIGSYSYTKSNLHPTNSTNATTVQATRIPGLSGHVYSITGYYEKNGFQLRGAYRYRSAFKGETTQLFATRGVTEILADKDVSAQVGYTFQEGSSLEGLGILFQVNNLTDSPYRTRIGTDGGGTRTADGGFLPETYEKYGRQFLFGINYRF